MANATSTELQELYVAYFGRAADPTGLDYWVEKGTTTAAFAASMHAQDEFKEEYGSLSVQTQVNQIYNNLFEYFDTQETIVIPMDSPQNLSPGRFGHAVAESAVRNLEIRSHPEVKIKENHPKILY